MEESASIKKNQGGRISSLISRTFGDLKLTVSSALFALKNSRKNGFLPAFLFRRSIEISHISPFRNLLHRPYDQAEMQLSYFGGASLKFDFSDPFQMAVCEEFVKFNIYDMDLVSFRPDIVIDGGAYRGYFTFLVNNKFPACRFICVEPHPNNYKELMASLEKNKVKDFKVYNNALARKQDHIVLEMWGSNMARTEDRSGPAEYVKVPALDLIELIKTLPADQSLLLKVDIEGSELDFFPECIDLLPAKCAVFLETHDGWTSLPAIRSKFESCGFKFSVIRDRDLYIDSFAIRG